LGAGTAEKQGAEGSLKEDRMKLIVSVLLVALALACLSCSREVDWLAFSSHEGGFMVEAPGILTERIASIQTMMGPVQFTTYVLEKDKVLYMVGYSDWPDSLVEKGADELLDFAIQGAISNLKGRILRNTSIALGKYQGRELIVDQPTKNQEHAIRVYLVGSRMYQLSVVIPKRDEFKENRTRFLDGFRLLN
jgi:hypothetical protein